MKADPNKTDCQAKHSLFLFCAMAAIFMGVLTANAETGGRDLNLEQFKWENRLLFLFAPEQSSPEFSELQREISGRQPGVADRDLVVFKILENGSSRMNSTEMDSQTAAAIRKRFFVPEGRFTVILVGKDGGIKMKTEAPVTLDEIFDRIDSMPMRKEEMRRKD